MDAVQLKAFGVLALSALVASCGGSSDQQKELLSGVFSDSPVGGLNYVTPSVTGVTDEHGVYNYREGETVVFSVGNLALPVVVASELVTPLDMASGNDLNDPAVVNIARLLQSLDEDNNPENGITIPETASAALSSAEIYDPADEGVVEAVVAEVYGDEREAVTADAAMVHFVDTLSANANSDGTLEQLSYMVPSTETFAGDSLSVDQESFSLTIDGETHEGPVAVNQGVYQLTGDTDTWFVSVNETGENTLACIETVPTAVADCNDGLYYLFMEQDTAMAFNVVADNTAAQGTADPIELATGAATDAAEETTGSAQLENTTAEQGSEEISLEGLFPSCGTGIVDDNGDGYGWQNNQTCLLVVEGLIVAEEIANGSAVPVVEESANEVPVTEVPTVPSTADTSNADNPEPAEEAESTAEVTPVPSESTAEADQDPATSETPVTDGSTAEAVSEEQPDLAPVPVEVAPVPDEAPQPDTTVPEEAVPEESVAESPSTESQVPAITDIIVLTGQSNAAGVQTAYDATLDASDEKVFAFTENGQWEKADLNQYWDDNLPSNFSSAEQGREPFNNLVFQVGKSLSGQTDRVVGIILITAPGEGISHWDYNSAFYTEIRTKVSAALNLLPQKSTVDAMIWMQGETDWLAEGTADTGATGFTSTESDFYLNYYPNKLDQLINNLRSEWWFGGQAQFICGETKRTSLNHHLMALNDDGDDMTSCAQAADLATRDSDPFGNHYSAESLRTLGGRIAELYLSAAD